MQNKGEIDISTAVDGTVQTEVRMEGETLRPSQKMMAELFDHASDTAGLHLKNIYAEQELEESATAEFFLVVQIEGDRSVFKKIVIPESFYREYGLSSR